MIVRQDARDTRRKSATQLKGYSSRGTGIVENILFQSNVNGNMSEQRLHGMKYEN